MLPVDDTHENRRSAKSMIIERSAKGAECLSQNFQFVLIDAVALRSKELVDKKRT